MRTTISKLLLASLALAFGPPASAGARLPGDYMNEFHTGYTTPHVAWAKPYAGGRTRAFFIAPWTAAREVTELAQRLDLEVRGETTFNEAKLGDTDHYTSQVEGTSPEDKAVRLRRKLAERYDVFVIANFPFNSLPTEIQYLIARQVVDGAGLVLAYRHPCREEFFRHPDAEAAKLIASGIPFGGLDFYREVFLRWYKLAGTDEIAPKLVSAYRAKKGRVVQLDFGIHAGATYGGFCLTPQEPFTFRSQAQYEYHQMLVINSVLWAAGREPAVRVAPLPVSWVRAADLPRPVELVFEAARSIRRADVTITIRNAWGDFEQEARGSVTLRAGATGMQFYLEGLCGGGHYVSVRVRDGKQAVAWGASWLEVEPAVGIAEVRLDKLSFERAEAASGLVRLRSPAPGGVSLSVQLLDNCQRVYARTLLPIAGGASEARFSVPLDAALSQAGRCRVRLFKGGKLADRAEAELFVPNRQRDAFPTLLWGTFPGILGHWVNEQLRSAGFNMILAPHYSLSTAEHGEGRQIGAIARDDMLCMPYTTHITRWSGEALGDDATYAKHREDALAMARHLAPYGPFVYSLGDENSLLPEMGYQPGDRPGFAEHLKRTYGSLDALNAAWGTQLARWEDAAPVKEADAHAGGMQPPGTRVGARREPRLAAFHDSESYREALYARWHRWHHDLFKSEDRYARVGSEGSEPGDLEQSIEGLEFWGPYRRTVDNTLLRSLAPRELVRGNWFGGYIHPRHDLPGLRRFLWDTFLDGNNLFEVYCCYTCETIFQSDLTFGYWTETFLPDLREVVDGIGQLAAASEHETDPVAIYHSQASEHAARVHTPFGHRNDIHEGALALIEDAGYQTYYITPRKVLAGALAGPAAPKVLFLAYEQALSDEEARAIVDFVHAGGVLIADVCPAIFDGHSAPRKSGALDGLFGVRRAPDLTKAARGRLLAPAARLALGDKSIAVPAVDLAAVDADASVSVAGGVALGKVSESPAVIVHGLGKGMAVLLNFPLSAYRGLDDRGRHALRELAEGLIAVSGTRPACRVVGRDGKPLLGCRAPRFRRGAVRTLMLLPRREKGAEGPVSARLELAAPAYIFNQRTGAYLGHTSSVRLRLHPTSATILSLLPYRNGVAVADGGLVAQGGFAELEIALPTVGGAEPTGHVLRVRLIDPDGKELWLGARTLFPAGANTHVSLPFAFNDRPGTWTALVRDVATRTEARYRIRLEENHE